MLLSASEDGNYSTFKNIIAPVLSFIFALLDVQTFLFKLLTALVYGIYVINSIYKLYSIYDPYWGIQYRFSKMTD
jgi:hypothetical protein